MLNLCVELRKCGIEQGTSLFTPKIIWLCNKKLQNQRVEFVQGFDIGNRHFTGYMNVVVDQIRYCKKGRSYLSPHPDVKIILKGARPIELYRLDWRAIKQRAKMRCSLDDNTRDVSSQLPSVSHYIRKAYKDCKNEPCETTLSEVNWESTEALYRVRYQGEVPDVTHLNHNDLGPIFAKAYQDARLLRSQRSGMASQKC